MSFAESLRSGGFPVALEITPPKTPNPRVLLRRASLLGDVPAAVNVIQRPGRQSSLDASIDLRSAGLAPAWHLVTRGRPPRDVETEVVRAAAAGLDIALVLLGDHAVFASVLTAGMTIRDTIRFVRQRMPVALIGATVNQYANDQAALFRNLAPKLHAGAAYVQGQPVFDVERFHAIASAVKDLSPQTKVVAMAMPLLSGEAADRVSSRLGFPIPEEVRSAVSAGRSWDVFADTLAALRADSAVDGVAVMTFETDPAPDVGDRILECLRSASIIA
ncbi:MAG: methylenetetrahydrofolate reductase [Dehalococcoidia bacterium]